VWSCHSCCIFQLPEHIIQLRASTIRIKAKSCAVLVPWRIGSANASYLTLFSESDGLFVWLVADGWCWFILREKYWWVIAGG
jgi:hypothetical protein